MSFVTSVKLYTKLSAVRLELEGEEQRKGKLEGGGKKDREQK